MKREEWVRWSSAWPDVNVLTEQNVQASLASLKPAAILIEPALGDYSARNFDELPKTVPIGEAAARAAAGRLAAFERSLLPNTAMQQERRTRVPVPPTRVRSTRSASTRWNASAPKRCRADADQTAGAARERQARCRHAAALRQRRLRVTSTIASSRRQGAVCLNVDAVEKAWGPN
jgi:NTE family protein